MHRDPSGDKFFNTNITQSRRVRKCARRKRLFRICSAAFFCLMLLSLCAAPRMYTDCGWRLGRAAWREGAAADALRLWSSNSLAAPFARRPTKLLYWRVKALERLGRNEEASRLASLAALRSPLDFYTMALAYEGRYPCVERAVHAALTSASYPHSWRREVERASAATGVSKNIIWGLMRQESRFRADAVSRAGAVGLMQLMPLTAREAAARLKDRSLTPYIPTHNIRLGSAHFAHLLKRFHGSLPQALAAYNAGAANAARWPAASAASWMDWIEDIPYAETREYLRCVLENIEVYSASDPQADAGASFFAGAAGPPPGPRKMALDKKQRGY